MEASSGIAGGRKRIRAANLQFIEVKAPEEQTVQVRRGAVRTASE